MHASNGLVLFAHGARDPGWARPFEAVAERVRALQPQRPVVLAYLELMTPNLREAARALIAQGCSRVDVLPLFLGTGGHVRNDLPRLLDELAREHASVHFELHPPAGEAAPVIEAMATLAAATARDGGGAP